MNSSAIPATIAGRLAALGVTPNFVSYLGVACAVGAAVCLAIGAGHTLPWEAARSPVTTSWWPLMAGVFLGLSAAADLLDGALARGGNLASEYGAVLDSTLDRFGDMAIFTGCAVYFARTGNATYVLVSCLALASSVLVSYVKARAENYVEDVGIGFWQRGERVGALLCGAMFGRMPTVLWVMAIFQLSTVVSRVRLARTLLAAGEGAGRPAAAWPQSRTGLSYLLVCVAIATAIFLVPWVSPFFYGISDPLGTALTSIAGHGF